MAGLHVSKLYIELSVHKFIFWLHSEEVHTV
jgi:hypothetical protein